MTMCCARKHLSLYRLQKGSPEMSDTKPFTASEGWLHRFWNRFRIKNITIIGENRIQIAFIAVYYTFSISYY